MLNNKNETVGAHGNTITRTTAIAEAKFKSRAETARHGASRGGKRTPFITIDRRLHQSEHGAISRGRGR
jgi:hypothetical protein